MKICKGCEIPLVLDWFYRSPRGYYDPYCRLCAAMRSSAYHAAHKDTIHARHNQYRSDHIKEITARERSYEKIHHEERIEKNKQYRLKHREEINSKAREYRAAYPEKSQQATKKWNLLHRKEWKEANRQHLRDIHNAWRHKNYGRWQEAWTQHNHARRVRMNGAARIEKVDRRYIYDRDRGICHICRRKVAFSKMTLDHLIPLSKGGNHTHDNLAVAHRSCNCRRGPGRLPAQLLLIG